MTKASLSAPKMVAATAAKSRRKKFTQTIDAAPPGTPVLKLPGGKLGLLVNMLTGEDGATLEAMMGATGWQKHSVRGAIAGALKKKAGLNIRSEKTDAGRAYRIISEAVDVGAAA